MSMRWMIFTLAVLLLAGFASAAISGNCDSSMVAYWQMEGDALDSFGSHDGTGFPNPATFIVGDGASFDGNQMMSISDSSEALSLAGGGFAIEFWVRKDSFADPLTAFLLNKDNYQIKWTAANEIEATVGINNPVTITGRPGLSVGEGHHVVLTWHATKQNLTLYVDNVVENSTTLTNPDGSSDPLEIGEDFVGLIDEVALYGRAFTAWDVNFHWATSADGWDYCHLAGAGEVSTSRTDFTLAGCPFPGGGGITAGSCSRNGMYYCGETSFTLYETLYDDGGCSMENPLGYESGTPQCCPSGYLCGDDPDTPGPELVCNQRTIDCSTQENKDDCDHAGCFWLEEEGGICVDNPSDYSCSIYQSEDSCNLDVWNVGAAGMGTEVCGTYFVESDQVYVIPQGSCNCDWTNPDGDGECVLGYDVVPDIYGGIENTFRCQKDFTTGECIDGLQQVSWTADGIEGTGNFSVGPFFDAIKYAAVLAAAGCETDAVGIQRDCGEPIVKLPAFSFFALMSSMGIIGLVYFFKRE